ncbi:hypothetical protein HBDW_23980 [Herbaspirillum sp. DW155]|uniref:MFS transporter n=1 Tax=Herbaspirillum sp. DW155 TaxID=3095609 RepID=UPI0030910B9A|nr:hypothetical protein HBDW_23980 [Herbaspirillum sp. DW155]
MWLSLSRLLQSTAATLWAGSMPRMMVQWDMSASLAGLVQSAWHVGYLIALFGVGFISDRIGPRRVFFCSSMLTVMAMTIFSIFSTAPQLTAWLYGLVGLCSGACYSPGLQLVSANCPAHARGRCMGWFIGASSLGYGLSLILVAGLMAAFSWQVTAGLVTVLVGAGAAAGWRWRPPLTSSVSSAASWAVRHLTATAAAAS